MQFTNGKVSKGVFKIISWCENDFRALKAEASGYYGTVLSRKAGMPLCITLCVLTIALNILLQMTK